MSRPGQPITAKELGQILYEEFERDEWGDVDPFYFKDPPKASEEGNLNRMGGLYEVLDRSAKRLNKRFGAKPKKGKYA